MFHCGDGSGSPLRLLAISGVVAIPRVGIPTLLVDCLDVATRFDMGQDAGLLTE